MSVFGQIMAYLFGDEQVQIIAQAFPAFLAAVLAATALASALVWWVLNWKYRTILDHNKAEKAHSDAEKAALKSMLTLREDQLSSRFQSTPRDEAVNMIEALKAQVASIAPRRITSNTKLELKALAAGPVNEERKIDISWEALAFDAERLAHDLISVFDQAGWHVEGSRNIGGDPTFGVALSVATPESDPQRVARLVLEKSGLTFKTVTDATTVRPHIEIGHPVAD